MEPLHNGEAAYHEPDEEARIFMDQGMCIAYFLIYQSKMHILWVFTDNTCVVSPHKEFRRRENEAHGQTTSCDKMTGKFMTNLPDNVSYQ